MILNTQFIFIFTYFSINKFRESLDRRYLLVASPALLPKYTIITRYCNHLDTPIFCCPKHICVHRNQILHLFINLIHFFNFLTLKPRLRSPFLLSLYLVSSVLAVF